MLSNTHNPQSRTWETDQLRLAGYLIAADVARLVKAYVPVNRNKVRFVLSQPPSGGQLSAFYDGTARVSALRYFDEMTALKAAVHDVMPPRVRGAA